MLILIGSDGKTLSNSVSKRFGHSEFFIVFDTTKESFKSYKNIDEGHNHKNLQEFLDKGVRAFVVGNIGPHAFELVNTPQSKVYLARKMSIQEAINKFKNNELKLLTGPTVKHSIGHGHDEEVKNHHEGRGRHRHHE